MILDIGIGTLRAGKATSLKVRYFKVSNVVTFPYVTIFSIDTANPAFANN